MAKSFGTGTVRVFLDSKRPFSNDDGHSLLLVFNFDAFSRVSSAVFSLTFLAYADIAHIVSTCTWRYTLAS